MIFEERPWGNYSVIHVEANCQVKKLVIHPGKRLSVQSHKFRSEHWFIISGEGVAEVGGGEISFHPGDSIDISVGAKHRMTGRGESDLVLIEVQTGTSFAEEDIVRYEDDFGRLN